MRIAISNIADKFKLKFKRLFYAYGPEVWEALGLLGHAASFGRPLMEHNKFDFTRL